MRINAFLSFIRFSRKGIYPPTRMIWLGSVLVAYIIYYAVSNLGTTEIIHSCSSTTNKIIARTKILKATFW